jgi:hypothetical protein
MIPKLELSFIGGKRFARKVGFVSGPGLSANSVYLCVLCVKYIGANDLTQRTQRFAEIRRDVPQT